MKRKAIFLQYILKQEKTSMVYQVFEATHKNPIKNDFVKTCERYLNILNIKLSFQEIENMSEWSFKKLVKTKTKEAGFKYLLAEKEKQSKISNIVYKSLGLQEYFVGGYCNIKLSKLIFKARSKMLDIKLQRKWKYEDKLCIGCKTNDESGDEILACKNLSDENVVTKPMNYNWFYKSSVSDIVEVAHNLAKRLKSRQNILEDGVT